MEEHPGRRAQNLAIAYAIKRRGKKMAEGGRMEAEHQSDSSSMDQTHPPEESFHEEEMASAYTGHEGNDVKENHAAEMEDARDLNQHGEEETGPMGAYAFGGMEDGHQTAADELDMVGHIMKQRQMCYSEGGKVANDTPITAGFEDNDFDDLALRDDLSQHYTGANSGDEIGNRHLDEQDEDMVSRIMRSRAKKDRNPVPA